MATRVQFRGFVPDETKFQLLAAADVFALPSLHEAFGLVYLEAMHCGLPVIAGAARRPGRLSRAMDGRAFSSRTTIADALLAAAAAAGRRPGAARSMSAHNRTVAQRFSIAGTAGEYESLFSRIGRIEPAPACATA